MPSPNHETSSNSLEGIAEVLADGFDPGDYRSKQQLAYDAIRDGILQGRLGQHMRLAPSKLAAQMGTSPLPVREALHRLEAEGLVTSVAHRGARVAPLSVAEMEDVFEHRALIESHAARVSVRHLTRQQIDHVIQLCDEMDSYTEDDSDGARFSELNRQFHWALYAAYPGPLLDTLLGFLYDRLRRYRAVVLVPRYTAGAQIEHRAIAEAVTDRDADRVADLTAQHIERARALLREHFPETPDA